MKYYQFLSEDLKTVDLETDPTEHFKPMSLSSSTVSGTFTDQ